MSENTVTTPMATEAAIAFLKEASRYFSKVGHNGEDAGFWAAQQNSINCLKIVALIEELSAQRMTGTPSKDRAGTRHAAYEILCRIDAPTDDKRIGIVAANLDKAFAEGMKRAAEIAAKRFDLRDDTCARIAGARIADAITKEARAK